MNTKNQKRFISEKYDDFSQKIETRTLPMSQYTDMSIILHKIEGYCSFSAGIRHIKTPELETLVLDVDLDSKSWFF